MMVNFWTGHRGLFLLSVFSFFAFFFTWQSLSFAVQPPALLKLLKPAEGYSVSAFATDVTNARLMVKTSEGDILVSQPGLGAVSLLKADKNGDGISDGRLTLLENLRRPFGLALDGSLLYVAEETRVVRYQFDHKLRKIMGKAQIIIDNIPAGGHSSRTIAQGPDGWFYLSVGSSCNVCIERHKWRASLLRFKPGGEAEIFATGLRNTVGFDWHPLTGALYAVDNGRDWLGDDLPPGEVNEIIKGGFYGWPFFYGRSIVDTEFGGRYRLSIHGKPIDPAHEFGAHVAPLSLRFLRHVKFKSSEKAVALVGQHGSWNRSQPSGYKVVKLSFDMNGDIVQSDFLSGFLQNGHQVLGRPVDSLELSDGTILISDDLGGVIWKMVPTH